MTHWRQWAVALPLLAALNLSLTFTNVWPTPKVRLGLALSVELAIAVLALVLAGRWADRLARGVLPATWVLLVVGRYLDVTAPGLYGREFNIYWDAPHLGNVTAMLVQAVPAWQVATAVAAVVVASFAAWAAARWTWRRVATALAEPVVRRPLAGLAGLIVAAYLVAPESGSSAFSQPVSAAYARQAGYALALVAPAQAAPGLADSPALDRPLTALGGADVVIAFVEAYGAVTFERTDLAAALADARHELGRAADAAGREVVSAYVESPTFGASSWLAHLTLLTGLDVRDQFAYVAVMRAGRDSLPRAFARRGYRTVAVMPGMRQAWPEGAFYGFDRIYDFAALDYRGPRFGWWTIPDQFSLARLAASELAADERAPVLAVFPTGTTHAPFGPVPPYQPDWTRVLSEAPFAPEEVRRALATPPELTDLSPSYARAVDYALRAFAGFVREQADAGQVLVLVGDHQPVAAVAGPGAPYHVPVHVIASPGPILDRLRSAGFADGVAPSPVPLGGMHALTTVLLDAFE